jgi:hypothetical protein
MKAKISLLTAIFMMLSVASFATVLTVSNHSLAGSMYSTFRDAYDAAANGDTILLEGTLTDYHTIYQEKQLVIMGAGLNTQKENFLRTKVAKGSEGGGTLFSYGIKSGGSGSKFYGITFVGGPNFDNRLWIGASDILFENCQFDRVVNVHSSNVVFKNCIFIQPGPIEIKGSVTNVLFSNCIFNKEITGNANYLQLVSFDHCLFLSAGACFINCLDFEIRNCIFMNSTGVSGITSSTFQNNLCRNSFTFPPPGNIDAGGNLTEADPLLVNYTYNTSYSTQHDYDLQTGSPAIGAASDSTDIGVHGGYSNFSEYLEVLIMPVIRSMHISNNTVPAGGTIHVNVEASKPHDD